MDLIVVFRHEQEVSVFGWRMPLLLSHGLETLKNDS